MAAALSWAARARTIAGSAGESLVADEDKDEGYEVGETIDNCYIITEDDECNDEFFEALIKESGFVLEDCVVQVYQARTASLSLNRRGELEVDEADCSTGCSGSPVYERLVD